MSPDHRAKCYGHLRGEADDTSIDGSLRPPLSRSLAIPGFHFLLSEQA